MKSNFPLLIPGFLVKDESLFLGSSRKEFGKSNPGIVGNGFSAEDVYLTYSRERVQR
jgi:hypothetical protein